MTTLNKSAKEATKSINLFYEAQKATTRQRIIHLAPRKKKDDDEGAEGTESMSQKVLFCTPDIPIALVPTDDAELDFYLAFSAFFEFHIRGAFRNLGITFRRTLSEFKQTTPGVYFENGDHISPAKKKAISQYMIVCEGFFNYVDFIIRHRFSLLKDSIYFPYSHIPKVHFLEMEKQQGGITGVSLTWREEAVRIQKFCVFLSVLLDSSIKFFEHSRDLYKAFLQTGETEVMLHCFNRDGVFALNTKFQKMEYDYPEAVQTDDTKFDFIGIDDLGAFKVKLFSIDIDHDTGFGSLSIDNFVDKEAPLGDFLEHAYEANVNKSMASQAVSSRWEPLLDQQSEQSSIV